MNLAAKFHETHPHAFFLNDENISDLQSYLLYKNWIDEGAQIKSAQKAGEGNMNKVLRVKLENGDTFIIKQARPWVEKFPDIPAPAERADIEGRYYQQTNQNETIGSFSPRLLHADSDSHTLMMEDLGEGSGLTYLYGQEEPLDENVLDGLMQYISALHQNFTQNACDFYIENRGMRTLNAEHIFRFPFIEENGLDLDEITPGLADLGAKYRSDNELLEQIDFLKYRYLSNGDTLLQGDFYPGSFLQTDGGVKVIDPEFCYFGDAEFDLGVLYAHLLMARQPEEINGGLLKKYDVSPQFSKMLFEQYAGIEIMRRILGLAQLPLPLNLAEKEELLERAYKMLLGS